jgi:nicotinate-nucleotide pyrophosphorylase (carboxylating)
MTIGTKQLFPVQDAQALVQMALQEDVQTGDVTSLWTLQANHTVTAVLIAKASGVLAGLPVIHLVLDALGIVAQVQLFKQDGDTVQAGEVIAELHGPVTGLLTAERTLLNFIQHLSGVATVAATYQNALGGANAFTKVLDTRKTLPGYRRLQKYAVVMGGGSNHRMGLHDMVLIKDNHIQAAGGVVQAIRAVQKANTAKLRVEVEVENLEQLQLVLQENCDVVMLDNMDTATMEQAVQVVRSSGKAVQLEASGNMHLQRVQELKDIGLDYISVGALTHSVQAFDISMRIPVVPNAG